MNTKATSSQTSDVFAAPKGINESTIKFRRKQGRHHGKLLLLSILRAKHRADELASLKQKEAEQLRALNKMKNEFFVNVTHELQTPLTMILRVTWQLSQKMLDPDDLLQLSAIHRSTNQLLGLVNQLLNLWRLEAGALPIRENHDEMTRFITDTLPAFYATRRANDDTLTKPFHLAELRPREDNLLEECPRRCEHWLIQPPTPMAKMDPQKTDPFMARLYAEVDARLDETSFGVEQLARELGMSRSSLLRKVKTITGLTATELLRNHRLRHAAHLLRQGETVAQVGYQTGFESPAYFTQCFRQLYGVTPSQYAFKKMLKPHLL